MSFNAGDLKGTLTLVKDKWDKSIANAKIQIDNFGDNIEKNRKKVEGLGTAMTVAGAVIALGMKSAVGSAIDAGEINSKFAYTFRDIKTESSAALDELIEKYGMSKQTGEQLLSNTADIFKGFNATSAEALSLSQTVQKLAADHTSFNNIQGGVANASMIITKASLGEREALAQLGIKIAEVDVQNRLALQGKKDLTGQALLMAKAEATLQLIMEQSGGAIGDYARTADSAGNVQRLLQERTIDLKTAIGNQFLPIVTAATKGIISMVSGMSEWIEANPILASAIAIPTGAMGLFMLAAGPILIALPRIKEGLTLLGTSFSGVASMAGKLGLSLGALFVGVKIGEFINDVLGLKKAIQGLVVDSLMPSLSYFQKISDAKMGWTEHGSHARMLKDEIIKLAQAIDPTVNGLTASAKLLKSNSKAYDDLHPRLKRIVDGLTGYREEIQKVAKEEQVAPEKAKKMAEEIEAVVMESTVRIQEITLSETDFKIAQLDRELAKNLEILSKNRATKDKIILVERAHALAVQKVRSEAYKAQQEKIKKQEEEEAKKEEALLKEIIEKEKEEERRWETHHGFLTFLKEEQQNLIYKQMEERGQWRDAELERVEQWELDQKAAAYNRLHDQAIDFRQYQDEVTEITKTAEMKREDIERQAREREEREEKEKNQRLWQDYESMTQSMQNEMDKYFNFLTNLNTVYSALQMKNLNNWYDEELAKIKNSEMTNEEKEKAIANLNEAMHKKKAGLENESAKREKALAIAQAIANTAVAVTTALKSLPWPLNLPAIAFAIATGAAQIAMIGGAWNGPGIDSYGDGGDGGSGGGGPGDQGVGGDNGGVLGGGLGETGGRGLAKFQSGTGGYIIPPSEFMVGEPYSPEIVRMSGDIDSVRMSVTPIGEQSVQPPTIINNLYVSALDAASFVQVYQSRILPLFIESMAAGQIIIPRGRVA